MLMTCEVLAFTRVLPGLRAGIASLPTGQVIVQADALILHLVNHLCTTICIVATLACASCSLLCE